MITWKEASENPELIIKHKNDLKDIKIFDPSWRWVFQKYPHLYREFSDRYSEMDGDSIDYALRNDPTLVLDLKEYLHRMSGWDIAYTLRYAPTLVLDLKDYLHKLDKKDVNWLLRFHPGISPCLKYKDDPNGVVAAYYNKYPHELDDLNNEEKREILKRIIELLKKHLLV